MKRKVLYLLQCVVMIVLSACSEDDLQSLQAAFESNVQEVTMGESVTFKDASTGEPTKWNWHFDGGEPETSVLFSPSVVYNKPGVYSVILSVGRGSNVNEIVKEQYITVNYPSQITANFSADKTTATNEDISKIYLKAILMNGCGVLLLKKVEKLLLQQNKIHK